MKLAEGTFQGLHPLEVELFQKHLKGVSGVGVEIGCLDGYSSAVILESSDLHLTSIDPFIPDSMEASLIGSKEKYLHNTEPWADRRELMEDYSSRCVGICGFEVLEYHPQSQLPIRQRPMQSLDFLFIDGDHTFSEVWDDFHNYTPHLKPGGILAIHDARMGREGSPNFHEGPSRVAREMIFGQPDKWSILGEAFSLVIARKR